MRWLLVGQLLFRKFEVKFLGVFLLPSLTHERHVTNVAFPDWQDVFGLFFSYILDIGIFSRLPTSDPQNYCFYVWPFLWCGISFMKHKYHRIREWREGSHVLLTWRWFCLNNEFPICDSAKMFELKYVHSKRSAQNLFILKLPKESQGSFVFLTWRWLCLYNEVPISDVAMKLALNYLQSRWSVQELVPLQNSEWVHDCPAIFYILDDLLALQKDIRTEFEFTFVSVFLVYGTWRYATSDYS